MCGSVDVCVYLLSQDESRLLRLVNQSVIAKAFKVQKDRIEERIQNGSLVINNERQKARIAVLDWSKETDLPEKAQLSPENNGFQWVPKKNMVKSCKIEPVSKKRVSTLNVAATDLKTSSCNASDAIFTGFNGGGGSGGNGDTGSSGIGGGTNGIRNGIVLSNKIGSNKANNSCMHSTPIVTVVSHRHLNVKRLTVVCFRTNSLKIPKSATRI
jgi:hypothetical protein